MPDSNAPDTGFPLPPASFSFLVESIIVQTQTQLGAFYLDQNEQREAPNLPLARHSIDLLSTLHEKTRGNLTADEQVLLENGLTELRFRFVQVSEELKRLRRRPQQEPEESALTAAASGGSGSRNE